MIVGEVRPTREALIRLEVASAADQAIEVNAVIDTGFTDYLTLPRAVVGRLGLRFRESMTYELANGELDAFELFEARMVMGAQSGPTQGC